MPFRVRMYVVLVCLLAVGLPSCLARRRLIARKGATTTQPLLTADPEQKRWIGMSVRPTIARS